MSRLQLILFLLIILSTCGFGFPCKDAERATLLQFKHSFNDACGALSSWVAAGSDCCSWDGVACDNVTGNVIKLDIKLGFCVEAGQVNPSPLHLLHLQHLSLKSIDFNWARIPNFFGSMSQLQYLDLSRNYALEIDILPQLANLTTLVHLDLGNSCINCEVGRNNMEGVLKLVNLKYLDMTGINLSQAIETLDVLHKFPSLSKLVLSSCQLGNSHLPIPNSNVSYSVIEHLDLSDNLFIGSFPRFIQNLTSIKALDLSYNNLTSSVPIWLGKKINLQQLNLGRNGFTGFFPHAIQNLSFLTALDLSTNLFRSSIPSWLATKKYLNYLDLSSNHFNSVDGGVMNFMSRRCSLQVLDLANNQVKEELLESFNNFSKCRKYDLELPTTGTLGYFQDKFILQSEMIGFTGQDKVGKDMPFLRNLILANNYISGSIPSAVCHFPSLQLLDLQKNSLTGVIPDCWGNSQINIIDLSSNALSGLIPNSLSKVDTLQVLRLYNNSLQGGFSHTFSHRLIILDVGKNNLDGEIPLWNGTNAPFLQILVLRENRFNGTIPPQLCSIDFLRVADLASNDFSGTIPLCFGQFQGMMGLTSQTPRDFNDLETKSISFPNEWSSVEVIKGKGREYTTTLYLLVNMDLSCNNLVGTIPAEISNLSLLVGLNLSHNHLIGPIPKKMGMMKSLESLDLSSNNLSGPIPESISSLDSLSNLNLAFNNFQGQIPTGLHFQTLTDPSIYMGNPGLCGDPLSKKCFVESVAHPPTSTVFEDEEEEEDNKHGRIWLYIVITTGFATGFWGVIGSLVFLRNLRHAYFRLAEEIADWIYVRVAINVARVNRGR